MSAKERRFDDSLSISTEDNLLGSSVSFTIGDNSIHIKEKQQIAPMITDKEEKKDLQWWLKKPATKKHEVIKTSPVASPMIKENFIKESEGINGRDKDKDDDTLDDLIESAALDKYESDFEDEDIGSLLDEMSKMANGMSPIPESAKSKSSSNILTEEECSAKELLQEADKLMKENDKNNIRKQQSLKNRTPSSSLEITNGISSGEKMSRKLDLDLSEILNSEMSELSAGDKKKISPRLTNDFNTNQRSDAETSKLILEEDKENMQKEINDIEKELLDVLVKKSQEKCQELSTPSSFDERDFANFLKILKDQDKDENLLLSSTYNLPKDTSVKHSRPVSRESNSKKTLASPRSVTTDIRRVENAKGDLFTVGLTPRLELFADAIPKLMAEKSSERQNQLSQEKDVSPKSNDSEDFCFKNLKSLDSKGIKDHTNVSDVYDYNLSDLLEEENEQLPQDAAIVTKTDDSKPKPKTVRPTKLISPLDSAKPFKAAKKSPSPKSKLPPRTIIAKYQPKSRVPTMAKSKSREYLKSSNESLDLYKMSKSHDGPLDENLEYLYEQERYKCLCMQKKLESEVDAYKGKIKDIQMQYDQEMFSLKKENILLNAKLNERMQKERDETNKHLEEKIGSLRKEIGRLENVITVYEVENKKLLQDNKHLQTEVKKNTQKPKVALQRDDNNQLETVKDLKEKIVNLELEVRDLREKNSELTAKYDDSTQQNDLLQEELEMIKDQLEAKNEFITDRLHVMTTNELQLRKKVDDMQVEINTKHDNLKLMKSEYDKLQYAVAPIQKEILQLRSKCGSLEQKLQTTLHDYDREKQHNEKLKEQVTLENKTIVDLTRQIKEMEKILKRKNPDSVSALILSANAETERVSTEKVRLLEERIAFLENEIRMKEDSSQAKLRELQKKFELMREKYSLQSNSGSCEDKGVPNNNEIVKVTKESSTQTLGVLEPRKSVEMNGADKEEKKIVKNGLKIAQQNNNIKEDAHLIATIRGLKLEMSNKDRNITKLKQEFQELQKTNRRLHKERERLLNDRKNFRENERLCKHLTGSDSKLSTLSDKNSGIYHNGGLANSKKISASAQKLYDPAQFSEDSDTNKMKKLSNENEVLKQELSKLNKELVAMKNKRLQDLNILQEEHEREITSIVKEYSAKAGDSKALKLQGQVNSQMAMINHLKEQTEKLQDYKDQVFILKKEREHLEGKCRMLNDKVKYLATPGTQQLQILQEKISILQQRHESREMSLQKLVRDLLRSKTQCKDCKGEKGMQLCYFRQELDNIIGMLQELSSM